MPPPSDSTRKALFLSPETPELGAGGGGIRSASLLAYLRARYATQVLRFNLRWHSKATAARAWRLGIRFLRRRPPLWDRYSGYEAQLEPQLAERYDLGVVEHFWCASYARLLRPRCGRLVLDLHNLESELAGTIASGMREPVATVFRSISQIYARLEREWIPQFDLVLVASEDDRRRIQHPHVVVFPNALPEIVQPEVAAENCIALSGTLAYYPNREGIAWFKRQVWPQVRREFPGVEWRLIGRDPEAVAGLVAGDDRIRRTGPVGDAIVELARAKIAIVPLFSGSGTRLKILEAWAAGRAVVSTTLGAEGLDARDGEHLLIADDAETFAAAIRRLLGDDRLRRQLGAAGRAHYLDRFTWPAAWRALDAVGL